MSALLCSVEGCDAPAQWIQRDFGGNTGHVCEAHRLSVCDGWPIESACRPDAYTREAIAHLMAQHGHTLTPEQRAAVRGWLGRTA